MIPLTESVNLCTFCYKSSTTEQGQSSNNNIIHKFTKLLTRFVNQTDGKLNELISSLPSSQLNCCKDCENLVSSFCKVYHGIKCLELKLLLKLETLVNVMKSADKVVSRVKCLQQYFELDGNHGDINSHSNNRLETFQSFRTEIMKTCYRGKTLPNLQPRVKLKILDHSLLSKSVHCKSEYVTVSQIQLPEISQSLDLNYFTGWLISFAALASLVHSSNDYECIEMVRNDDRTINFMETDDDALLEDHLSNINDNTVKECTKFVFNPVLINANDENGLVDELMSNSDETKIEDQLNLEKTFDNAANDKNDSPFEPSGTEEQPIQEPKKPVFSADDDRKQISRPFACSLCQMSFVHHWALKNHILRKHRFLRRTKSMKIDQRENYQFHCVICKTSHKSYERLRIHRYSAFHRFLEKRILKQSRSELAIGTLENITSSFSNAVESDSSSSHDDDEDTNRKTNTRHKTKAKCYNLRKAKKRSYVVENDDKEDPKENSHSDDNFSDLSSSSSDASDLGNDYNAYSSSESSHDESNEIDDTNRRFHYCILDDCKVKRPSFPNKILLNEHQKLHTKGQYPCNFCDKLEDTAIAICLHECKLHSRLPSTSTSTNISTNIFYCTRCLYDTKQQGNLIKHFASLHLGIYNLNVGKVKQKMWQCKICKLKLKFTQNISQKSDLHYKTHHDTSGLNNPEKQLKKCGVSQCSAYFISTEQLRLHREKQHSISASLSKKIINENNDLEPIEIESLKCSLCQKSFYLLRYLLQHKQLFHSNVSEIKQENNDEMKPSWKRIVCSELKCTKSFLTRKALEVHKNLHGKFSCQFCDNEKDYAPDLANHEHDKHSVIIKEEQELLFKNIPANQLKILKCPRCPKNLKNRLAYQRHFVNDHLGLSTIHAVCSICKYTSHKESLRKHNLHCHYIDDMDPSKVSKCNMCPAYFRKEAQLTRHISKFHEEYDNQDINIARMEHQCLQCGKFFRSNIGLKNHQSYAHSNKQNKQVKNGYHCVLDKCKSRFKNKILLDRHQKLHERGNYPCKFCDKVFNTIIKLCMHEAKHHPSKNLANHPEGNVFQCSRCSLHSTSATILQRHFAINHMNIPLRKNPKTSHKKTVELNCIICGLKHNSALELAKHEAQHNNKRTKTIKCFRCGSKTLTKSYANHILTKHLSVRIETKLKTCPICQAFVKRLDGHHKTFHKTENLDDLSKMYKCEESQCKAYFLTGEQLVRHKSKMHRSDDTICKECKKTFKTTITLQNHMKQFHSYLDENKKLPFACDLPNCEKRFASMVELEHHQKYGRHQNKLEDERFKCEKCGKEFSLKNRLKSHLIIVHPTQLFICPECGKTFKTKNALNNHLEYHKSPDDWKFECEICGKKCTTKYLLKDHMKTHTKEKPFVCQYCGEKYAHQHNWKNHMLTKHKNEDNLPTTMKVGRENRISRKGTKKGDCIIAGVKQ